MLLKLCVDCYLVLDNCVDMVWYVCCDVSILCVIIDCFFVDYCVLVD